MIYHPTMSRWYKWPFLTGRVVIMGGYLNNPNSHIYSIGNPVGWGLIATCVGLTGLFLVTQAIHNLSKSRESQLATNIPSSSSGPYFLPTRQLAALLVFGYLSCWVPFCLVPRSQWNYHYALALVIGILCTGLVMDVILYQMDGCASVSHLRACALTYAHTLCIPSPFLIYYMTGFL